jgi:hypothetical protein
VSFDTEGNKVAKTIHIYDILCHNGESPDSVCGIQVGFLRNNTPEGLNNPLYVYGKYPVYANIASIEVETEEIIFDPDNIQDSLSRHTYFDYNRFGQITQSRSINSNGDQIISDTRWVPDYWDSYQTPSTDDKMAEALISFYSKNIVNIPVENRQILIKDGESEEYVTDGNLTTFKFFDYSNISTPIPLTDGIYKLNLQDPVSLEVFETSYIDENLNFIQDSRYERKTNNNIFTPNGLLLQQQVDHGMTSANILGYDTTLVIASFLNALLGECGYSGFEDQESNGWTSYYYPEIATSLNAKSGDYILVTSGPCGITQDFNVEDGLEDQAGYKASVWVRGNSSAFLRISINGSSNVKTVYSISASVWNLLEVSFSREEIESFQ